MAPLESADGRQAVCTTHGGRFEILFLRPPPPVAQPLRLAPRQKTVYTLAENAACAQHPAAFAAFACSGCGTAICQLCSFDQPDGDHLCPNCAQKGAGFRAPPVMTSLGINTAPRVPAGVCCIQHPNVQATAKCKTCGGFMCNTCKFDLPGGICICPTCASAPRTALSKKQKMQLIGSYVAAAWSTLWWGLVFSGALSGLGRNKDTEALLGLIMFVFILGPSIIGMSLGVSSMRRQQPNSISIWIATIWNSVSLGGFLLLMLVGMLRK